mmetsp:Transcript_9384/g.28212  ORF Transcript_9384/g.28212 Transcript_9384/m.28212 type:complete len:236 (+) Transcript_9384:844-1551(+)
MDQGAAATAPRLPVPRSPKTSAAPQWANPPQLRPPLMPPPPQLPPCISPNRPQPQGAAAVPEARFWRSQAMAAALFHPPRSAFGPLSAREPSHPRHQPAARQTQQWAPCPPRSAEARGPLLGLTDRAHFPTAQARPEMEARPHAMVPPGTSVGLLRRRQLWLRRKAECWRRLRQRAWRPAAKAAATWQRRSWAFAGLRTAVLAAGTPGRTHRRCRHRRRRTQCRLSWLPSERRCC